MKLLLDTCTFLWIITESSTLSDNAKKLFTDPLNQVYLSSVSVWEMIVKFHLGKLPLPNPPAQYIFDQRKKHQIESLALEEEAVSQLSKLPNYHSDPFDRMLICQAVANNLTLLTPDKNILQYPVAAVW